MNLVIKLHIAKIINKQGARSNSYVFDTDQAKIYYPESLAIEE